MNKILEACRAPSGKHMLDSGGDNGRHWQRPPLTDQDPIASWSPEWKEATLHTGPFLADWAGEGIAHDIHKRFDEYADECPNMPWFELADQFMRDELGLEQAARDNTYNGESDLDQCYVWEVWNDGSSTDWIYPDDSTVTVIFIHTGADVRGGYSWPIFIRPDRDYSVPVDTCVEWVDSEFEIDQFTNGYTSAPSYDFFDEVRVFPWLSTPDTITGWFEGKARKFYINAPHN
jgi:hypothetical protein